MSENIPDSFDPKQPDLPTLAVDPQPEQNGQGQVGTHFPADITDDSITDGSPEEGR